MPILEDAKQLFERATGYGRPARHELALLVRPRKAQAYRFGDDGHTPNNPKLPLLHYRTPVVLDGDHDPAAVFEALFALHGWKDAWRDGIYDFLHFHTATHEVLGIARGTARVQFGGSKGRVLHLKAGDAVVLPAGTGHRRLSMSRDLLVVGAYPAGGQYDEPKPHEVDHEDAVRSAARAKIPAKDPVYGKGGPMTRLWRKD